MKSKGFTFIELMVVITIIGVIFTTGIVTYTAVSARSRDARRKADLESVRQSLEMCRSLEGVYPSSIYSANKLVCSSGTITLMEKTPIDPKPCGSPAVSSYNYLRTSNTTYTLSAPCMESDAGYVVTNP